MESLDPNSSLQMPFHSRQADLAIKGTILWRVLTWEAFIPSCRRADPQASQGPGPPDNAVKTGGQYVLTKYARIVHKELALSA
jgi:hypothetical protein